MPRTAGGIIPDVIFNPFGLPSRMTLSLFMEAGAAKEAATQGKVIDATIFSKTDAADLKERLKAAGFSHKGTEVLYNSMNGKKIDAEIFLAPMFYQLLQKPSADAYQVAPGPNPIDILTRQPIEGRQAGGGLRIGNMEQNVLVANGVGRFIHEKMFDHSDGFQIYLCNTCGKAAIKNMETGMLRCRRCGDAADIKPVDSSWCSKSLFQILESCGVGITRHTGPPNLFDGLPLPS
jgi:DNA-directed RNA polymerase II subunit RPB2